MSDEPGIRPAPSKGGGDASAEGGPPGIALESEKLLPVRVGRNATLTLRAQRLGGYAGSMRATALDVPAGYQVSQASAPAGTSTAELRLEISALAYKEPRRSSVRIEVRGFGPAPVLAYAEVELAPFFGPPTFDEADREGSPVLSRGGRSATHAIGDPRGLLLLTSGDAAANGCEVSRFEDSGARDFAYAGTGVAVVGGAGDGCARLARQGRATLVLGVRGGGAGFVARLRDDGSVDAAFADGGVLALPARATAWGVDTAGRILVASLVDAETVLKRYLADGAEDPAFNPTILRAPPKDIVIDDAGRTYVLSGHDGALVVHRVGVGGGLDAWGEMGGGFALPRELARSYVPARITLDGAGRLLVAGSVEVDWSETDATLSRVLTEGPQLDETFALAAGGELRWACGRSATVDAIATDVGGSVWVAAGGWQPSSDPYAVVRHFGADGAVRNVPSAPKGTVDRAVGVVARGDGTAVVAAQTAAGPALFRVR